MTTEIPVLLLEEKPVVCELDGLHSKWLAKSSRVETGLDKHGRYWMIAAGDSANLLEDIEPQTIDCIVTSPPYFWLRDYDHEGQYGLEDSVDAYLENLSNVFSQCKRVLKKSGTIFINIGDTYYSGKGESKGKDIKNKKRRFGVRAVDKSGGLGIGLKRKSAIGIPWRLAIRLMSDGWTLRSTIIWDRQHSLPEAVKDRPRRNFEYVFMLSKHVNYYFDRTKLEEANEEDIWTISARPEPNSGLYTAAFPDALVERCLEIGCPKGGTVFDPFAGSGTTVRVAFKTKHNALGIDINPKFVEYAGKRIVKI
jgi:DNA modification methylase